jgi:hypothetical protein
MGINYHCCHKGVCRSRMRLPLLRQTSDAGAVVLAGPDPWHQQHINHASSSSQLSITCKEVQSALSCQYFSTLHRSVKADPTARHGPACGSIWEAHPEYTNGCTREDSTISTSRTYTLPLHLWVRLCRNYVLLGTPKHDVTIRPVLAQGSVCGELET